MPDEQEHAPDGMPAAAAVAPLTPIPVEPPAPPEPPAPERLITCPTCGHEAPWRLKAEPDNSIIACDKCGQRVAFGVPIALCRAVIHPDDARFIAIEFEHKVPGKEFKFTATVDAPYARDIAAAILRKRTAV